MDAPEENRWKRVRERGVIQCGKRVKCSARGNWFGSMAVASRGETGRLHPASLLVHTHTHTHKVVQLNFSSVHDDIYSLVLTHWALSYRPGSVSKRATTTFSSGTSAGDVPELVCLRCVLTKSSVKKYVYFSKAISYLHWLSIHYGHEAWYWQFNVFLIHKTFSYDQQRYFRIIFIAY